MRGRSGHYVKQPSGYKAFIPTNLPPNPEIEITAKIRETLELTHKAIVQLNGIASFLPYPELFITMTIRKEALLSSQIEGTQATMTDVLIYETWDEVDNFDDVQEVVNYIKALTYSIKTLQKLPLSVRIIKEAHKFLLDGQRGKNKLPGQFRRSQNWIGPSLKNAVFIPPPSDEAVLLISNLEKFINHKNALDPLITCALIHYQFETAHPFLDGNGRIGRLLVDLFLHDKKIVEKPLLYISLFFKQHRQEYFDRLMVVRNEGDYEQWVLFFLKALLWSAEHSLDKIKQILALKTCLHKKIMKEKKASIRSIELLDELFFSPLVSVSAISSKIGISYQGAKDQVDLFTKLKILEELTGQKRGKRYAFAPYLKIIEE